LTNRLTRGLAGLAGSLADVGTINSFKSNGGRRFGLDAYSAVTGWSARILPAALAWDSLPRRSRTRVQSWGPLSIYLGTRSPCGRAAKDVPVPSRREVPHAVKDLSASCQRKPIQCPLRRPAFTTATLPATGPYALLLIPPPIGWPCVSASGARELCQCVPR
jgi:hypothetical protein